MFAIIAIAVFSILFCVLAFFSSRTWLWRHVTLLFGVFVMTVLFLVLATVSLKTQQVWRGQYETLNGQIEAADKRISVLRGPTQINEQELSLPQLNANLSRLLLDRGRVWRGAVLASADANSIKLDMSNWNNSRCVRASVDEALVPQPAEEQADAAATAQPITESTLLHAFINAPASGLAAEQLSLLFGESDVLQQETRGPCTVPNIYVGQFVVVAAEPTAITLQPVRPLDERQQAAVQTQADWTLYEILPADGHEVFAGLSEEAILSLLPTNENVPADKLAEMVREYVRDNTNAENQDPPERVHSKIKFVSDHSIQVDVDAEAVPEEDRVYDTRGRAIPEELRQGKPTDFKTGDVVEFDSVTAKRLVDQGVAEFVDEPSRYVRWLRNYELIFRYAHDARSDVQRAISVVEVEMATLKKNTQQIQDRIAYHQQEKQLLQQDLAGFENDLAAARAVLATLKKRRAAQVETLNQLYRANRMQAGLPMPGF